MRGHAQPEPARQRHAHLELVASTSWPGTRIRDTRDGVYFSFVDRSEVRDNDIEGVRYGLHYMYSDENRFEGNVFRDNAAGAALMNSKGIVLRRNQFLANQSHRSYGVLLQTVEGTTLEAQPHRRQHRSACSSRAATAIGSSTTRSLATTSASTPPTAPTAMSSPATASSATCTPSRPPAAT